MPIVPKSSAGPPLADRHARFWGAVAAQLQHLTRLIDPDGDPDEAAVPLRKYSGHFWALVRGLPDLSPPEALDPGDVGEAAALGRWTSWFASLSSMDPPSFQQLLEDAQSRATKAARRAAAESRARWKVWLSEALAGSASAAHRLLKPPVGPEVPKPDPIFQGHPATTASDMLEVEPEAWAKIWGRHSRVEAMNALATRRVAARASAASEPITSQRVLAALKTMPDRRGKGADGMPPRLVKDAPPEAIEALASLLTCIESEVTVPFQELF